MTDQQIKNLLDEANNVLFAYKAGTISPQEKTQKTAQIQVVFAEKLKTTLGLTIRGFPSTGKFVDILNIIEEAYVKAVVAGNAMLVFNKIKGAFALV